MNRLKLPAFSVPHRPDARRFDLITPGGVVTLECLDEAGLDWFGEHGETVSAGSLKMVLRDCLPEGTETGYLKAVLDAAAGDLASSTWRREMLVKRGEGVMFHASRCENRESIQRHGLDWRHMTEPGIAGSDRPEWPGVFLSLDLESAEWFARMPGPRRADIWSVRVDGLWLVGDPGAGGGDDYWMISLAPIGPDRIEPEHLVV